MWKSVMNYRKPAFWIVLLAVIACVGVALCFLTNPIATDDHFVLTNSESLVDTNMIAISAVFNADPSGATNQGEASLPPQRMNQPTDTDYPAHKSLFEPTPIEQFDAKYDNEEFVITKLHYENLDGEWVSKGYTYKYRLEITGKLSNSAKNITYIVLSNTEDITFDQTLRASGISSNMADYFDPSVAVIVGHRLFP